MASEPRPGRGIIPARAGVTCSGRTGPGGAPDHPRSRGVYTTRRWRGPATPGSSPLARGLHYQTLAWSRDAGIIPARAGFTCVAAATRSRTGDHPRSRGVYLAAAGPRWRPCGSSPLARGLRGVELLDDVGDGIIPARAGFTRFRLFPKIRNPDHPRSRGVYDVQHRENEVLAGSSPLARGLPGALDSAEGHQRIIPARAGFTCSHGPTAIS